MYPQVLCGGRIAVSCVLFAALLKPWAKAEKAEMVGTVLQIQGDWRTTEESPALRAGEGVSAGASIKTASGRKTDSLVVVLLNGQRLAAVCKADPCTTALQLPDHSTETGVSFQHIVEAVKYVLLNRHPEVINAFSSTASRGSNSLRSETVMAFNTGKALSLVSALRALPQGDYTLELIRAPDAKLLYDRNLQWDLSPEQSVVDVPAPGAYVVLLKDKYENTAGNVFLAVVAPAFYNNVKTSFEQARQMCAQWDGVDAADSAHLFLRAYLLALTAKQ